MAKLNWRTIGWLTLSALPIAAAAQIANPGTPENTPAQQVTLGGTPAFDLIRLNGLGPGIPLRKGNVVPGSERVQLDNQVLNAGPDYGMDYVAGVVYVKRMMKPGQSLTVFYRYDDKAPAPSREKLNGVATMKLDLVPGKFGLMMGMGMAERNSDGTTAMSNVFGFNTNFSAGSSNLKGIFLYGERQKVDSESLMGYQGQGADQPTGKSSLILQNLSSKIGSGNFEATYQDVSKNFTNFGSALAAGYDAKVVDQLQKEKGLKRMGFGFNNVQLGGMSLNQSFKSVQDGSKSVDWKSFGLKQGGFTMGWSSRTIDKGFNRFKDLAEADRDQLAKEVGMSRQSFSSEFAQKIGTISFSQNLISDGDGSNIERRELLLNTKNLKFNYGDQTVGKNFRRIGSILPNEQAMYGAELGVRRQWLGLEATFKAGGQPLKFARVNLATEGGDFTATDFSTGGKGWSLEHSARVVDQGFNSFGALNASADEHIKAIANMYSKEPVAIRPEDKGIFLRTNGVDRDFTRVSFNPFKDVAFSAQHLDIRSPSGKSSVDSVNVKSKKFALEYRKQNLDDQYDPNKLMMFERDRLGLLPNLDRSDLSMQMDLGGNRKLAITSTDASMGEDEVQRKTLKYTDKKIELEAGVRQVDAGFMNAGQLVDGEKDLLASLRGFSQKDLKIKWQVLPNLKIDGMMFDAKSDDLSQEKMLRNLFVQWKPDKKTDITYTNYANKVDEPNGILFANFLERFTLFRDFGRLGKVAYLKEKQDFDGVQTSQPDAEKEMFAYEAKLDQKTSLRTEQTQTKYSNGDKENVSANTISTEINKRVGVSVSDVNVDRTGTDRDEKKRNYGIWVDFGRGFRFNWGYARQLNGDMGTMQSQTSLTGGTAGNWRIGDAGYSVNYWDNEDRTQATTKFSLGTIKPMKFGFLSDVMLNVGMDSASDRARWIRENKLFGFTGKIGSNSLGFDYKSQVAQDGQRGIDRVFAFKTDQSDKRWLRGSIYYKVRTLPNGKEMMIRDFSLTVKPSKQFALTHSMVTNPEQPNGGVLLGTLPSADRRNKWSLDYQPVANPNPLKNEFSVAASWDELINDQTRATARTAGATLKLTFAKPKTAAADDPYRSQLQLFYGLEQNQNTNWRRLAQRYSIQYDQRPGPNQIFSFMVGNLSYEHSFAEGFKRNNWTARLDYQLRF